VLVPQRFERVTRRQYSLGQRPPFSNFKVTVTYRLLKIKPQSQEGLAGQLVRGGLEQPSQTRRLALLYNFGMITIPEEVIGGVRVRLAKSASNLEKHGIDFTAVQALWDDPVRVEIPARTVDEPRWLAIGQIAGRHWSAVVTYREQRVRIISARRSRKEETALYEG